MCIMSEYQFVGYCLSMPLFVFWRFSGWSIILWIKSMKELYCTAPVKNLQYLCFCKSFLAKGIVLC